MHGLARPSGRSAVVRPSGCLLPGGPRLQGPLARRVRFYLPAESVGYSAVLPGRTFSDVPAYDALKLEGQQCGRSSPAPRGAHGCPRPSRLPLTSHHTGLRNHSHLFVPSTLQEVQRSPDWPRSHLCSFPFLHFGLFFLFPSAVVSSPADSASGGHQEEGRAR